MMMMNQIAAYQPRSSVVGFIQLCIVSIFCVGALSFTITTTSTIKTHVPLRRNPNWKIASSTTSLRILPRDHQRSVPLTTTAATTTTSNTNVVDYECIPLLNFRDSNDTINYIDRLDDAIMGGISTSTVRQPPQQTYAIWNGVCRTDGGGFCGFRTNPFTTPFLIQNNSNHNTSSTSTTTEYNTEDGGGFYIKCRLVSDNEPERRVWKLSTRTKPDRGERLYQAPFEITKRPSANMSTTPFNNDDNEMEWQTIHVPFDRFRLVRGPQVVTNGLPLNVSAGIYQLGMTMSQFVFAAATTTNDSHANTTSTTRIETTLPNFRDGYFELHIEEMGVYRTRTSNVTVKVEPDAALLPLNVLSKVETKEKRSVLVKALFVVAKLFFSEQSQRRKSTLRILRNKYNMTRYQAIVWGFQRRLISSTSLTSSSRIAKLQRIVSSMVETLSILMIDTIRSVLSLSIKLCLFYPLRLMTKTLALFQPKKTKATTP